MSKKPIMNKISSDNVTHSFLYDCGKQEKNMFSYLFFYNLKRKFILALLSRFAIKVYDINGVTCSCLNCRSLFGYCGG
jgi:hypothetical protein